VTISPEKNETTLLILTGGFQRYKRSRFTLNAREDARFRLSTGSFLINSTCPGSIEERNGSSLGWWACWSSLTNSWP